MGLGASSPWVELGIGKPSWPSLPPQALKQCTLAWYLQSSHGGQWESIHKAYFRLLMAPGTIAVHKDHRKACLVLHNSKYGFITYRAPVDPKTKQMSLAPLASSS